MRAVKAIDRQKSLAISLKKGALTVDMLIMHCCMVLITQ